MWEQRILKLAQQISTWSKDPSKKVGAIIVRGKNNIISVGYNGLPKGIKDDNRLKDKEWKLKYILHAEENALINATSSVEGCTIFCTHTPCSKCSSQIIQYGINRVIVPKQSLSHFEKYGHNGINILREANIEYNEVDI